MIATALVAFGGAGLAASFARAARRTEPGRRLRDLSAPARWRLPSRARRWLQRALEDAAIDVEPEQACEMAAAVVAGIAMLTYAVSPGLLPVAVPVMLGAGPIGLRVARDRARQRFTSALPSGVEQVAAALRGGATVGEALGAVADAGGPLGADLARVRARASLGVGVADALAAWPAERPLSSVRAVAGSLAVASTIGGRAADALDGLAGSLRERLGAIAEARALSAQSRLSAVVVGAAPIGFVLFSAALDPASVDVLVATHVGRICLVAGLVCEALAALWMRQILRGGDHE